MADTNYQFRVENAAEIDLQRIVDENPESSILLVRAAGDARGLLLADEEWLSKYIPEDGLYLGGALLTERWGYCRGALQGNGNGLKVYQDSTRDYIPVGWRCRVVDERERRLLKHELAEIASYKRGIKVKIKILGWKMRRELSKVAKEAALALLQNPGAQDDNAVILRGMVENKSAEKQASERFLTVETVYRARHIWLATLGAIVGKRYVWESTRDTRGFLHTGEVADLIGVMPSQMPRLLKEREDLPKPTIKNKRLIWPPEVVGAWVGAFNKVEVRCIASS
jgi:hypothetical protein